MSQYPEKKPSGRANFVWVLGGGYLVYTAYKLIRDLINGQSEMYALSIVTAVIFAATMLHAKCHHRFPAIPPVHWKMIFLYLYPYNKAS